MIIIQKVMDSATRLNVKCNPDKIQYMVSEVKYTLSVQMGSERTSPK